MTGTAPWLEKRVGTPPPDVSMLGSVARAADRTAPIEAPITEFVGSLLDGADWVIA